jgi:hypothetical protein
MFLYFLVIVYAFFFTFQIMSFIGKKRKIEECKSYLDVSSTNKECDVPGCNPGPSALFTDIRCFTHAASICRHSMFSPSSGELIRCHNPIRKKLFMGNVRMDFSHLCDTHIKCKNNGVRTDPCENCFEKQHLCTWTFTKINVERCIHPHLNNSTFCALHHERGSSPLNPLQTSNNNNDIPLPPFVPEDIKPLVDALKQITLKHRIGTLIPQSAFIHTLGAIVKNILSIQYANAVALSEEEIQLLVETIIPVTEKYHLALPDESRLMDRLTTITSNVVCWDLFTDRDAGKRNNCMKCTVFGRICDVCRQEYHY